MLLEDAAANLVDITCYPRLTAPLHVSYLREAGLEGGGVAVAEVIILGEGIAVVGFLPFLAKHVAKADAVVNIAFLTVIAEFEVAGEISQGFIVDVELEIAFAGSVVVDAELLRREPPSSGSTFSK